MDDPAVLRERVQKSIVNIITRGLESGTITEERAKLIANHVLNAIPEDIDLPKLIDIIPKLDDQFAELTSAVVPIMREYEQRIHKTVNDKISDLIQNGKLDEALKVTKTAIELERNLS
jgi:hypothetical protein